MFKIELELSLSKETRELLASLVMALSAGLPAPSTKAEAPVKAIKTPVAASKKTQEPTAATEPGTDDFNMDITNDDFNIGDDSGAGSKEEEITPDMLKTAAVAAAKGGKKEKVTALVVKHGGTGLSTIPVENYKAFLDDLKKLK